MLSERFRRKVTTDSTTGALVVTTDIPCAPVGHLNSGTAHTLLAQRPYRHSLPSLQGEPTAPLLPAAGEEALWHITLESPLMPAVCCDVLWCVVFKERARSRTTTHKIIKWKEATTSRLTHKNQDLSKQ